MKEEIESVFNKIIQERDYQDHMCTLNGIPLEPTVEGEIVDQKSFYGRDRKNTETDAFNFAFEILNDRLQKIQKT